MILLHKIIRFRGKYFFLSNMYPCKVELNGLIFPSAEHAFQAAKCVNREDVEKILRCKTGKEAKIVGRKVKLREDWERIKDEVMYRVVKAKFNQNKDLAKKLIDTYPAILVEGNTWRDTYWGVDLFHKSKRYLYGYRGRNKLGEILMEVREELRKL